MMREKYQVQKVYGKVIVSDHYWKQVSLTNRLHRAAQEDEQTERKRRSRWKLATKRPIVVRFHADWKKLPANVPLKLERDLALYAIRHRLCIQVHTKPEAIIEATLEDVLTPPESAEVEAA